MRALVGIAMLLEEQTDVSARSRYTLPCAYAHAIERAGGIPVQLPVQDPDALLERIDALVIPGGGDFLPERPYPPHVGFDAVVPRQLAFDRALLAAALARELPVLGICYGMQLLALELGGALHYDIPSDVPRAAPHRLVDAAARHALEWTPGSRLAAEIGAPRDVNSRHHQAVADPGPVLRASARTLDGLIEAIEDPARRFCVGVQWHPETLGDAASERLFAALVASARRG
jgi:putative glutamine amidotransferase